MREILGRLGRWMVKAGRWCQSAAKWGAQVRGACDHDWKITHACMSHYHYACTKCGAMDRVIARFPITGYKPGAETGLYWMPAPYSVPWSERCKAALAESSAETSSS